MKNVTKIGVLDDERIAVEGLVSQLVKLVENAEVSGFMYAQPFVVIVAPPFPITAAMSFLSTVTCSIFGVCFPTSSLEADRALFISPKI